MSFTCPVCWRTSYHPEDEKWGYCGNCHDFTGGSENMRIDCDQCGGSETANGQRCPCREEDDRAQAMRSRMGIVKKPPSKAPLDAGAYKPSSQINKGRGKPSHGQKVHD